jgi:hypothetical protein
MKNGRSLGQSGRFTQLAPVIRRSFDIASMARLSVGANINRMKFRSRRMLQARQADSPVLRAAIAISPSIRAAGEEIEHGRHILPSIVAAMKDAGDAPCVGWSGIIIRRVDAVPRHRGTGNGRAPSGLPGLALMDQSAGGG